MSADDAPIVDADAVPDDSTLLFTVRDVETADEREALLTRLDGEVSAWFNYCQHWTDVRLDRGDGAPVRGEEILCRKHGATFEKESGVCTFGPCEGATLESLAVTVEDGGVYLADDDYAFVHVGEAESEADADLSTSPADRLGF